MVPDTTTRTAAMSGLTVTITAIEPSTASIGGSRFHANVFSTV